MTVQLMSFLAAFGQNGKVMRLNIHANSLEQNLVEESSDLSLGIYLPPDYEKQSKKRFPVVYWLHGYSGWKNTTGKTDWGDKEAVGGKTRSRDIVSLSRGYSSLYVKLRN